jgi:hypothetical protein
MVLAEKLGYTVEELAERMTHEEYRLWDAEHFIRDEERRDRELEARAKAAARRG